MKKFIGLIIICILSWWSIRALTIQGYFPMHDDTQVARVYEMGVALQQGQFPVRWVSNLGYGYGYPLFNFYGPLPYYVGGALYAAGIDVVLATKMMFGLGIILSSIFMYICLFQIVGLSGALVGATVFLYAPYHTVEVYIRGSVGEYWALAFLPLVCMGIWNIWRGNGKVGILTGSIGFSLVILSHTITGFLVAGILGIGIMIHILIHIIRGNKKKINWYYMALVFLGLCYSSFFRLPAIAEMQYTSVKSMIAQAPTVFSDHYICLSQLWNAPWGYGGSAPGCVDGLSLKIGKFHTLVFIGAMVMMLITYGVKRLHDVRMWMYGFFVFTVCSIFFTLPYTTVVWNMLPFTQFIQYPWRLLLFVIFGIGFVSSYIVYAIRIPLFRYIVALTLIICSIWINAKNFHPQYIYGRDTEQFITRDELRYTKSKISDEYLPENVIRPTSVSDVDKRVISDTDSLRVKPVVETDTVKRYELNAEEAQEVPIRLPYFPGWRIKVNGNEVRPTIAAGLPSVVVSEGRTILELKLTNTIVRSVANMVSLVSIVGIILFFIYGKKTNA